jgi:hypothetical protein
MLSKFTVTPSELRRKGEAYEIDKRRKEKSENLR